jgi:hypothetical protein
LSANIITSLLKTLGEMQATRNFQRRITRKCGRRRIYLKEDGEFIRVCEQFLKQKRNILAFAKFVLGVDFTKSFAPAINHVTFRFMHITKSGMKK